MNDSTITFSLHPEDNDRLALLCGAYEQNLQSISEQFAVDIVNRSNEFVLTGPRKKLNRVKNLIEDLTLPLRPGYWIPKTFICRYKMPCTVIKTVLPMK